MSENQVQVSPKSAASASMNNAATSLIARMAEKLQVDAGKLWATLTKTCFKPDNQGRIFTNEEVMYVLMVAEQLGINPLRRELWAFRGKDGSIQPIVSIDGWKAIMLRQPNFDGYQVKYSDTTVKIDGLGTVPEWAECTIWLKNVTHPTVERVFMQEVYVPRSPVWNKSPRLMLHHRALIQAIRFSFPVTGISDVGVTESGDLIDGEDLIQGQGSYGQSMSQPQPKMKTVTFSKDNYEVVAAKAVAMARQHGNYDKAFQFANSLDAQTREYVMGRLENARNEDQLQAIRTMEQAEPIPASGDSSADVIVEQEA